MVALVNHDVGVGDGSKGYGSADDGDVEMVA